MDIGSIVIWGILGAILLGALTLAFFMWMNFHDASLDSRSYNEEFDPGKMISRYWQDKDESEPDPYDSLKRWAMPPEQGEKSDARSQSRMDPETETEPEPAPAPAAAEELDPIVSELLQEAHSETKKPER